MNIPILNASIDIYKCYLSSTGYKTHYDNQVTRINKLSSMKNKLNLESETKMTGSMQICGMWHGMTGVLKIAEGDRDGWTDLIRSYYYHAWNIRAEIATRDRIGPFKRLRLRDNFSECIVLSMIYKDFVFAKWCGDRIVTSFKNNKDEFAQDEPERYYDPLVIQLYATWQKVEIDMNQFPGCELGFYTDLARNIAGTSEDFAAAVYKACESCCHIDETYVSPPLIHIPAEILTAMFVRKELGLSVPTVSHPLLETPFCKLPDEFPRPVDPLLDRAVAKIREAHPEIGDPW